MRHHRFANYNFENPPLLEIAAERLIAPLFGPGRFSRLLDAAGLAEKERVLDFGCGGGIGSRVIARRIGPGGALTCLDLSAFWLSQCRKRLRRFDNVTFLGGDIRKLPVPEAFFDLVFIHRVLRFIGDEERAPVIEALAAKLRPGGRMLICEKMSPQIGFEAHRIRKLATDAGLAETYSGRNGSRFTVRFEKPGSAASA
ncbi:MAG: class I SAM-dependent methyltransferase [Desulfobacterales bacterium]